MMDANLEFTNCFMQWINGDTQDPKESTLGPCVADKQKQMNISSGVLATMVSRGFGLAIAGIQQKYGQNTHYKQKSLWAPFDWGPLVFEPRSPKL